MVVSDVLSLTPPRIIWVWKRIRPRMIHVVAPRMSPGRQAQPGPWRNPDLLQETRIVLTVESK